MTLEGDEICRSLAASRSTSSSRGRFVEVPVFSGHTVCWPSAEISRVSWCFAGWIAIDAVDAVAPPSLCYFSRALLL